MALEQKKNQKKKIQVIGLKLKLTSYKSKTHNMTNHRTKLEISQLLTSEQLLTS